MVWSSKGCARAAYTRITSRGAPLRKLRDFPLKAAAGHSYVMHAFTFSHHQRSKGHALTLENMSFFDLLLALTAEVTSNQRGHKYSYCSNEHCGMLDALTSASAAYLDLMGCKHMSPPPPPPPLFHSLMLTAPGPACQFEEASIH